MKKNIIVLLTVFLSVLGQTQAQRYLPSQKYLEAKTGSVDGKFSVNNFYVAVALSSYTKGCNYWLLGAEYLQKGYKYDYQTIPKAQFTLEGGYFLNLLSDRTRTISLSLGASALAGYETSNWDKKILYDGATLVNKDCLIYGAALAMQMEVYLSDYSILMLNIKERMLLGSTIGKFHSQIGIGIKCLIN